MTIQHFQILCGLCWLIPVVVYLPAVRRLLFTDDWRGIDAPRVAVCFNGICQIGFIVRWFVWPHATGVMGSTELNVWSGLYVLNGLCALVLVYVLHVRAKAKGQ